MIDVNEYVQRANEMSNDLEAGEKMCYLCNPASI